MLTQKIRVWALLIVETYYSCLHLAKDGTFVINFGSVIRSALYITLVIAHFVHTFVALMEYLYGDTIFS